jgi:hypothetical protein
MRGEASFSVVKYNAMAVSTGVILQHHTFYLHHASGKLHFIVPLPPPPALVILDRNAQIPESEQGE